MKRPAPALCASKIINKHLKDMLEAIPEVERSYADIEHLHRLRVSSRRLRTALWVFKKSLPGEKGVKARRDIRTVTKALGRARDLDTQITFYKSLSCRTVDASVRKGIAALIRSLRKERSGQQKKVGVALRKFKQKNVDKRIEGSLRDARAGIDAARKLKKLAHKKITRRLNEMLAYERIVAEAANIKQLHYLRIAAKRLRYTLENFKVLDGKQMEGFIAQAKIIQDSLGDMHNYYVWMNPLPPASGKRGDLRKARKFIARTCQKLYEKSYKEFIGGWKKQKRLGTWKRLRKSIAAQA